MKKYIEEHFLDYIVCLFIGSGLSVNLFAGYDMEDPWSGNIIMVAGTIMAAMAILFLSYYNKKGKQISVFLTIAELAAMITALQYTGEFSGSKLIDKSPLLFWIIVFVSSDFVFWLSRSCAGIVLLFLTGTLLIGAFDFLEYPVSAEGYLIFLFGVFSLFFYRTHSRYPLRNDKGKNNSKAIYVQPVILSLMVCLLAGGVYFAVVKPLSPLADKTELADELMSMQFLEHAGISSKKIIIADKPENSVGASRDQIDNDNREERNYNNKKTRQDSPDAGGKIGTGSNLISVMAITYQKNASLIWSIAVALILLLVSAAALKQIQKRRWYRKMRNKTKEDGAIELYLYFIKKMTKAGFKRPENLTLLEYATDSQKILDKFSVYDATFLKLTQIYLRILYGYHNITDSECELFHDFYKEFHKNLKNDFFHKKRVSI